MNRTALKNYAPRARREFIQAVTDRAGFYGLTAKKIELVTEKGDVAIIGARAFPRSIVRQRRALEERIARQGFDQVMVTDTAFSVIPKERLHRRLLNTPNTLTCQVWIRARSSS